MANNTSPITLGTVTGSKIPVSNDSDSSFSSNPQIIERVQTILERKRSSDGVEKLWNESYHNAERSVPLTVSENEIHADSSRPERKFQSKWQIEQQEKTTDPFETEKRIGAAIGRLKWKLEHEKAIEKVSNQVNTKEETKLWREENPEKKVRHTRPGYDQLNRGLELERWKMRFQNESYNGSQLSRINDK